MQEEVTQKTIALSMKTGKLTAQALQAALKKYLQHRAKGPKLHHGKQSLKQLKAHGAALTNIEVTEANIGVFKPCAKKYGVDFTLRKDKTTQPPHYIVFFTLAVLLGVLALAVHDEPDSHRPGNAHAQVKRMQAGQRVCKGGGDAAR